ncbi:MULTISPECIES: glutamate-1-semialdehyde 2,1-aminomutase [Blautia]|mgnify:FL=1|jgi:glutamate-1-semialdehyde 2,1-aminomutase|uniref:glutamate-1-semialdehyde 2,1-aminomutase n=1 Tax=Blautia TaxID=572511 RepID=UPI000E52D976|nr:MULTISPECIES: glutamate-1-semialdehyde 2,1-aminomutase [Blautia]RHQ37375.1 glutamate-1-semialdehyde-2,1-aminomutase [Ruminococcus sp. AF25-28AC]MCB5688723.1 glutamate-1-semialdehyde 2,1-aminomutase [Blautia wexlerae]NSD02416.1 glutamate-1-semialdehyde 2,1-aminomutase [Blautia wexlerae]NSE93833.1 glutamate-1-semialdehyde 2,1-aminomutase [Blautia wexlerae]NSF15422.1 glutamate-1-semialdehyde 2,1-aminomutase [Blautia wexlerae]
MGLSEELFDRAVKVIPGGVNSPVRAYGAIGIAPRFIDRADGCHIYDVDGKEYVDYIDSWGPMILGHNFPEVKESVLKACEKGLSFGCATAIEVEMAEFICDHIPHVDMVRMVNSGTEAVMSAVRVARGFTGKNKIIKFAGCYHGHSDAMLVSAGSGVMTSGVPDSAGVPKGCTEDTMTAVYNDLDSVRALMEQADGQTAAVIVEAVGANMGVVPPKKGFLEGLRKLCDEYGALLIFDEVITGFRLAFGGAAEYFGVTPDLVTYGKIIGAGMPVGAYGGRREIMELVSPVGKVYQAGTLSGNPIAMAAGLTQLKYLYEHQEIYKDLEEKGKRLYGGMEKMLAEKNLPYHINHVSSLGSLFFTEQEVVDYTSAKSSDTKAFSEYFKGMLAQGIHMAPSQFEAMFLSVAHTDEIIDQTLEAVRNYFTK